MADVPSTGKLKLFRSVQKFQHIQGFYPQSRLSQHSPYNGRNLCFQLCVLQMFLSATAFLLFKAQSMYDYGLTLYASLTEALTFVCVTATLRKTTETYELIENMENFIAKSKYDQPIRIMKEFIYFFPIWTTKQDRQISIHSHFTPKPMKILRRSARFFISSW